MGRRIGFFLRRSSFELYPHLVEHGGYLRKGCRWTRPYPVSVFHPVYIHLEVRVYVLTCTTSFLSNVAGCSTQSGQSGHGRTGFCDRSLSKSNNSHSLCQVLFLVN